MIKLKLKPDVKFSFMNFNVARSHGFVDGPFLNDDMQGYLIDWPDGEYDWLSVRSFKKRFELVEVEPDHADEEEPGPTPSLDKALKETQKELENGQE